MKTTRGWKWITNGVETKLVEPSTPLPEGWSLGNHHTKYVKTEAHRKAIGEAASKRRYTRSEEYKKSVTRGLLDYWKKAKLDGSGKERIDKGKVTKKENALREKQKRKEDRRNKDGMEWQEAVFERDNRTCRICGVQSPGKYRLHAHHIRSWELYPELRLETDNGLTVCNKCHVKIEVQIRKKRARFVKELRERLTRVSSQEETGLLLTWINSVLQEDISL